MLAVGLYAITAHPSETLQIFAFAFKAIGYSIKFLLDVGIAFIRMW